MNIKVSTLAIWVILFGACRSVPISTEKKSGRSRNHEASGTENYSAKVKAVHRNEQFEDLRPYQRPTREEDNSNRKSELPFSLQEFQALFRKYLHLFPQLRATMNENEDSDDFMDSNKKEHPINQSGNLNVYIKGNVHIKGSVHITTNGNGNGMRNSFDGKKHPVPITTEPQEDSDTVDIIGPEDPNSDVVIIPRDNYGNISRPMPSAKLPASKHQKL